MCGIFGLLSSGGFLCAEREARSLIESFYSLSESRGKEASGAAVLHGECIDVVKAPVRGRGFLKLPEAQVILDGFLGSLTSGQPFAFIGHTRMVTNGGDHISENNQPVVREGLVAIHNGIIVNEQDLWKSSPELQRQFEVDTEVLLALVARSLRHGESAIQAVAGAMKSVSGANSIALISAKHNGMALATSNGSMFLACDSKSSLVAFASERSILEKIVSTHIRSFLPVSTESVTQVKPGELVLLAFGMSPPLRLKWEQSLGHVMEEVPTMRKLVVHPVQSLAPRPAPLAINMSRCREIETSTAIDWQAIRSLRRCTLCVLPETFPFIRFDASGVCSICNNHRPYPLKGRDQLSRELEAIRRSDGEPELLFPISGGRDSCYGLHVIMREFGIRPVAYTYDWGMITDLARRNISKMCGKLGIEHVLISADIRRKREFINMNVAAWLKKPHLGTVPLFMAGDKQFFYYANMLKREMGLARTLFSMNPLERTDFKVGFCSIDESYHKERHYDPKFVNKLRLGAFYASQFLGNPSFINPSLMDSAFAYFSYYLIPKDFSSMFDYLPWYEHDVESVLLGEYGWETSPDTKSTWRIGDGTAAFYNYIYLKVAGLSENDTFRSNQIREGLITREEAMSRIYEDNQPRVESIAWYFDTIGLDAVDAIKSINRMPRRY